jgi:hypothetical protein
MVSPLIFGMSTKIFDTASTVSRYPFCQHIPTFYIAYTPFKVEFLHIKNVQIISYPVTIHVLYCVIVNYHSSIIMFLQTKKYNGNSKESILPGGWKSIPGLLKRFTKSFSDFYEESCPKSWCTNIKTFLRMSITFINKIVHVHSKHLHISL